MKLKTTYINFRDSDGVETIDEFTQEAGQSSRDFNRYVNEMLKEYLMSGGGYYKSSRATKQWRESDIKMN